MSYSISVDVLPDTREQEQREREAELIANGEAVRCTECLELIERGSKGFEARYCEKCARVYAKALTESVTLEGRMCTTINQAMIKSFLWYYEDEFVNYLMDEEGDGI